MVGWHHWLNGHKFEQALRDGEGQGSLSCCSPSWLSDWTTTTTKVVQWRVQWWTSELRSSLLLLLLLLLSGFSHVQLCNPMDCSTPGFPVLHYLPEFAQTHVHHLILFHPLLLLALIFPSIRVFSNESALCIRWPKYYSVSFSISLSSEYWGLISFRIDWFDLFAVQGTLQESSREQFESIKSSVLSLLYGPTLKSIHDS